MFSPKKNTFFSSFDILEAIIYKNLRSVDQNLFRNYSLYLVQWKNLKIGNICGHLNVHDALSIGTSFREMIKTFYWMSFKPSIKGGFC